MTLYCAIVHHMFSYSHIEKVTFKYFEKGHTFLSADSFHYLVESKIRQKKFLYDFTDYYDCVDEAGKAILMLLEDFIDYLNKKGSCKDTNYPKLCEISIAEFRKDSTKLFWKTSFDGEWQDGEFLQKRFRNDCLHCVHIRTKPGPRGLNAKKKEDILKKLLRLMPENRRSFWQNIPENDDSKDL